MQVTQLMEKIEEMVAGNRGRHYEMERQRREILEEKRRREEERVKERMMKVKIERESLRSPMGELRILYSTTSFLLLVSNGLYISFLYTVTDILHSR